MDTFASQQVQWEQRFSNKELFHTVCLSLDKVAENYTESQNNTTYDVTVIAGIFWCALFLLVCLFRTIL